MNTTTKTFNADGTQPVLALVKTAMRGERQGHAFGEWAADVAVCRSCGAYIQSMPRGDEGTALTTICTR